ncbi:prephenate dehydratase [Geminicoccaceae bacterium 1502E]|nr:prephenate dehydratase [Geminicoccaceae bacterium 1502E]
MTTTATDPERTIAFQGRPGAYSHMACREAFPDFTPLPCHSFEDAFAAVREGQARHAMIPVDNSVAGRVADVHHLLPNCGLHIVAEHFLRVNHHLLAVRGSSLERVQVVESHVHAVGQCRDFLRAHQFRAKVVADTAGAAADVAEAGDPSRAAIASRLAAETYGLEILASDIEDAEHNTTRFLVFAREPQVPEPGAGPTVTTFLFTVRNVPAALYKAMGGFATNGVNMVKLESYIDGAFTQAQFHADIIGHPQDENVRLAMEELRFFAHNLEILGVYPAHSFRDRIG